jgi:hypothetical protein
MQFRDVLQNEEAQRETLERTQGNGKYLSTRLMYKDTQAVHRYLHT